MDNSSTPPPPPFGMPAYDQPPIPAGYTPPPPASNKKVVKIVVGIVIGLFLLVLLFVGGLVAFVFTLMKSGEPYKHAMEVVQRDSRAQQKLGSPIKPGWFVTGSENTTPTSGNADIAIPVRGSAHSGTVYVVAKKSAGEWSYERLELQVDGENERVSLLPPKQKSLPSQDQPKSDWN
jgi:cytochrome oxidase complex assembly protein 1